MDGNPDVHAKTIRETLARQQQVIINAYFSECQNLAQLLSQSASRSAVTPELAQRIELYATLIPGALGITPMRHDRMPYRVFLGQVSERLRLTYDGRPNGYEGPQQFLRDLKLIATSLKANTRLPRRLGQRAAPDPARGNLRLSPGDARPAPARRDPSSRHRPGARRSALDGAHARRAPRPAGAAPSNAMPAPRWSWTRSANARSACSKPSCRRGIATGRTPSATTWSSGTQGADDVLAPLLLARWAEAYDRNSGEVAVDIAPLFESVDALEHCGDVMRTLLGDPLYRRHLEARGRTQCALHRLFRRQQGKRHLRLALRRVSRAGGPVRGAGRRQRASRDLPRARRQHRARRRPRGFAGAHRAGRHGQWRAAPDGAGRGHQPELRSAAHRHAHAGARLQRADAAARRRGQRRRRDCRTAAVRRARRGREPPAIPALVHGDASSTRGSRRSRPST